MNNLNFALFTDNSGEPSFYCKKNKFYRFATNENISITDLPYTAFFSYPALFDGFFINLNENLYPKIEFDIIFAAVEKNPHFIDKLREEYPKAKIVGLYKEVWNHNIETRKYVIENTDAFAQPYFKVDFYQKYKLPYPKNAYIVPQPTNHLALQNRFGLVNKSPQIFNYNKIDAAGRKSINNRIILDRVNLILKEATYNGPKGLQPFIEYWNQCEYMLSTDTFNMGGVQSGQCAALNTIMIGSNTDYQNMLFPDLVGIDPDFLVDRINKLYTNKKYKAEVKQYAFESFLSNYSFESVKNKIINLYKDLN